MSPDVDVRLVRADQSKLKSCGNIFPTKEEYKVRVYATTAAEPQSEMELIGSNRIGSGRIPDVVRYNSMRFDPIRQMGLYLDQE